ncbi:peptide chain release factor N(5)-glutamine methyltransferase [Novosphingobium terrae]|uniref:peptide chain release factor N(5)-glutamine methyltransferase n=1 Tax=Novosphingobium terrae TaxID=2726189 RepID=UPI00197EC23E|nr:peptide chain release factor N(5)-glutamine methyltransferase [Novosphingobium terrae]
MSDTVTQALREAATRLAETSDTARLDAEVLMAHALGVTRSAMLLSHGRNAVPETFAALIDRRLRHEPVAYITGSQEFFGLDFKVSSDVLIPRGDSEVLVEAALAARPDAKRVLDLGLGSGALLLAVLHNLPGAQGIGIERSPGALAVARANAQALNLTPRADLRPGDWTQSDWTTDLGQFDLILANPPYVEEKALLDPSVRDHEPASALFAGAEGLDDYRIILPALPALLAPRGVALIEIGYTQAEAVSALAEAQGLTAKLHRDLGDRPRVLEISSSAPSSH